MSQKWNEKQQRILSEQFEGITQQNKGFKANRTRAFTGKFGNIFITHVLCGTLFGISEAA